MKRPISRHEAITNGVRVLAREAAAHVKLSDLAQDRINTAKFRRHKRAAAYWQAVMKSCLENENKQRLRNTRPKRAA